MKLIIVARSKPETFARLTRVFADDLNVQVLWERRTRQRRKYINQRGLERRTRDRRRLQKLWNGRDYIVVHIAG